MKLPLIAFACLSAISATHGALVKLDFSGTVSSSNMPVFPLGMTVTLSLICETDTPIQSVQFNQSFRINAIQSFSMEAGSYMATLSSPAGQTVVYNNLGGTDGIQFQLATNPATYQFTNPKPNGVNFPQTSAGSSFDNMFINLATNDTSLYNSYAVPQSFDLADYPSTRNALFGFNTGSWQMGFNSVTATVVPEPSALVAGMAGLALFARRRRVIR